MKRWKISLSSSCNLLAIATFVSAASLMCNPAFTQTRDEKVRQDRESLKDDTSWFYDDLESGIAAAEKNRKPLMVVLRCIP